MCHRFLRSLAPAGGFFGLGPVDRESRFAPGVAGASSLAAGRLVRTLVGIVFGLVVATGRAEAFGFDDVAKKAAALSEAAYVPAPDTLPAELKSLTYDQYRDIRFRPDKALWRAEKLPFELMFFHRGKFAIEPVKVNEVTLQGERPIGFDSADFDYGRNKLSPTSWKQLGFAGFRVHYAINALAYKDELAVFLGASYFRMLGAGQRYGLSARGLAIDTVGGKGEEFPRFTEFWIERPAADAKQLVIYALLDSRRAAGAYRIVLKPGASTVASIQSRTFLRRGGDPVATLGMAPLTSMFEHAANQQSPTDFRPGVHDSDGLLVASGDEWLWRPLTNPKNVVVTSFSTQKLRGFGLMQRARRFDDYEDVEARYELRPSAFVTPVGEWGPGRVELMQLPAPDETYDNVVAYWVPERLPAPGTPIDIAYDLSWEGEAMHRPPNGWAVQTRRGHGFKRLGAGEVEYVVDFNGPSLAALPVDAKVRAVATAGPTAQVLESNAYRNEATGAWRMTLRVKRLQPDQPVELRAFLQRDSDALSETWTTLIQPD